MQVGRLLGACLRAGDVVALSGELGAGKTCFVKGVAMGLGLDPEGVTSPSFTLVNEYAGGGIILYHLDAYRLERPEDFLGAGLEEYLYSGGVAVMEWADKWPELLPVGTIRIQMEIMGESEEGHRLKMIFWGLPPGFDI
jgi:tRNA threonylcarbamoyladenosine biosynthesis protein TsaE